MYFISFWFWFINFYTYTICLVVSDFSLFYMYMISCVLSTMILNECVGGGWHSGNGVGRINEVTLRRARLVLGWMTCPGTTPGGGTLFRYVTSHPGRLSLSSFRVLRSINWTVSCNRTCVSSHGRHHLVNAYGVKAWCGWLERWCVS